MIRSILASIFLLTMCACSDNCGSPKNNNSIALSTQMSIHNTLHRLYTPQEVDEAPHPVYQDMKGKPVYAYQDACGSGSYLFDPEKDKLEFAISYSGLSGTPVMMHFHLGSSSEGGPIIQTIFGKPSGEIKGLGNSPAPPLSCDTATDGRAGFVWGVYKLEGNDKLTPPLTIEMEREALMNGRIYVNVHTYLNEEGEIRGQVLPCQP